MAVEDRGFMTKQIAAACLSISLFAFVSGCASSSGSVRLQSERPVTVHVGELTIFEVPSEQQYSIGSAGNSLLFVEKRQRSDKTVFVYRAAHVGKQTLIATPKDLPSSHCVSCLTEHYFVTVVP